MKKFLTTILLLAVLIPTLAVAQTKTTVPFGGTGQGSFPLDSLLVGNGTGALKATSSPTVGWLTATNTTATSTFAGGLISSLYNIFGATTFTQYPIGPGGTPTLPDELVDLQFVQGLQAGFLYKTPVIVVGLSNVTLSGEQTIDGFLTSASRVLLVNQSSGAENGCYVTSAGAWSRCTDYNQDAQVIQGTTFLVLNGDTEEGTAWALSTAGATVGTTPLVFIQVSKPQDITASNGLTKIGNDIQALYDDITIGLSGGALSIKNGAIDLAGSLISGILGIVNGGTGTSTAPTDGQLLIGKTDGTYNLTTLTEGDNITITNGDGTIEISSTGGGGASATTSLGSTFTPITFIASPQTNQRWTNQPATEEEIFNATSSTANTYTRQRVDLTRGETFYLGGRQVTTGTTGATLKMQCSADASSWVDAGDSSATISIGPLGTQPRVGNLASLNSACKGFVYLRLVGEGGNGVNDPTWRNLYAIVNNTRPENGSTATTTSEYAIAAVPNTAQTWTNMPAALTEIFGATNARFTANTLNATHYRIVVNQAIAGFAGADLNLQCSADNVTFIAADTAGAGEVDIGTGTGVKNGNEVELSSGCKDQRYWRLVGKQGNGVADPSFRQIKVLFTVTESATGGSSQWLDGLADSIYYLLGNVGIGTSTPTAKLHVDGEVKFQGTNFATTTIGNSNRFFEIKETSSLGGLLQFPILSGSSLGTIVGDIMGVPVDNRLIVLENTSLNSNPTINLLGQNGTGISITHATSTAQMVFDADGGFYFPNWNDTSAVNFGIGSSTPTKTLSVIGDTYLKGTTTVPLRVEDALTTANFQTIFRDLSSLGIGTSPVLRGEFSNGLLGLGVDQSMAIFGQSPTLNPNLVFYNSALDDFAQIRYATTSNQLQFLNPDSFYFDNKVGIASSTPSFGLSLDGIALFNDNVSSSTARAELKIHSREFLGSTQGTLLEGTASNGGKGISTIGDFLLFGTDSLVPSLLFSSEDLVQNAEIEFSTTSDQIQLKGATGGYAFITNVLTSLLFSTFEKSGAIDVVGTLISGILNTDLLGDLIIVLIDSQLAIVENVAVGFPTLTFISSNFQDDFNSGSLTYGTSTGSFILESGSFATTTLEIGNLDPKVACLKMADSDGGGYTYVTALNGVLSASTVSCEI